MSSAITTSGDGQYVVPDLRIGHYTVKAAAAGFKAAEQQNITLQVSDRAVSIFKLTVGSAQEQVTVEAAAIAVQSDTGEVSSVITGQQMTQLATNGRSMYSADLSDAWRIQRAGRLPDPNPVGGDANVSFNGMRESHNLYLLGRQREQRPRRRRRSDVMPSLDAIAEFRQMTSNYSAEYGLSSAGPR